MNSEGNIHHSLTRSYTLLVSWAFRALGSQKCIRFKRGTPKVLDAGRKKVSWLPRYATKKYTEESSETEKHMREVFKRMHVLQGKGMINACKT